MCGRYQRRSDKQKIAEAFKLGNIDGLTLEFAPDYNAAPQSMQPVIASIRFHSIKLSTGIKAAAVKEGIAPFVAVEERFTPCIDGVPARELARK